MSSFNMRFLPWRAQFPRTEYIAVLYTWAYIISGGRIFQGNTPHECAELNKVPPEVSHGDKESVPTGETPKWLRRKLRLKEAVRPQGSKGSKLKEVIPEGRPKRPSPNGASLRKGPHKSAPAQQREPGTTRKDRAVGSQRRWELAN